MYEREREHNRDMSYFVIEESLYGEQLIGFLFHQSEVGHDVVFTDPRRGSELIIDH